VIANAVFVSSLLCLALMMYALSELTFLAPYRGVILHAYGRPIALFCTSLFVNLFALVYMLNRSLFLKDTGQKLAHIEKQIRTGSTISEELSSQLEK
jgi:hypothetical protein